jgi:transposase
MAARFSQSMISSLTNRGKLRFMVYDGALSASIFLRFLKRLVRSAERKLFLVVDNLRPHRARIVAAWVAANRDKIELVYLPPYAPEHNPDEFVNNDVKQAMARRRAPRDKAELKKGLTSYMRGLQRRPDKVRTFFQAPIDCVARAGVERLNVIANLPFEADVRDEAVLRVVGARSVVAVRVSIRVSVSHIEEDDELIAVLNSSHRAFSCRCESLVGMDVHLEIAPL